MARFLGLKNGWYFVTGGCLLGYRSRGETGPGEEKGKGMVRSIPILLYSVQNDVDQGCEVDSKRHIGIKSLIN